MARARNIKPGFFKNADLVELPFEYRLLFIGLWTLADREGRLEDRPKQIRMELFPADNVDTNKGLDALQALGFVRRYEVDGKRFVQVVNFGKHQNPHMNEAKSTIPAPEIVREINEESTVQAPETGADITDRSSGASTVQTPAKDGATRADSLIPDSGFRIPEPPQRAQSQEERPPDLGTPLRALPVFQDPDPPETPSAESPPPDPTRAGLLSKLLREQGVLVTPSSPFLLGWLELDVTDREALDAVEQARFRKPKPAQIHAAYLDPIIREIRTGPKVNGSHSGGERWWDSEDATQRKASELGMMARAGESWQDFRGRIRAKIAEAQHAA